ncbi:hypothetical protein CJF42_02110 [Pseudoalteromonas sp. NBT06-2]|uniref:general secretion pathway protein GspB n=1 Tax=Pseudoalteromonas sp. NBT06-2 TaxID=2025950 RepID=UPI000BA5F8EE|nr:general secretion pathway protein GspB [Pseudoalteromonas sp. NBT06-2]PAJ76054.1 hypothetical protein CJF42_02110 [Pseudoalteromonas sp. NBT06-2]
MSYLLDALKQSEQGEVSRKAQYAAESIQDYSQQKDLSFYRKLAFSLLAIVAFVVILSIGFLAGRWFQESKVQGIAVVKQQAAIEKAQVTENQTHVQPASVQIKTSPVLVQQALPTQYQLVPVPNTYNTIQAYPNQQSIVHNSYPNNQKLVPVQNVQQEQIDYSQYKVVGKPIEQSVFNEQSTEKNIADSEIAKLPSSLKTAFAKAVAAIEAEENDNYEVTTATKNSAMAQPIQLLPDVIQSLIPKITYQAHIYATDSSRRWIKLNGAELYEGDSLGPIKILEIAPEITLMSIEGYRFSLTAMDDWLP